MSLLILYKKDEIELTFFEGNTRIYYIHKG